MRYTCKNENGEYYLPVDELCMEGGRLTGGPVDFLGQHEDSYRDLLLELERYRLLGTVESITQRMNPRYPPTRITEFADHHFFLSNFYPVQLDVFGFTFGSVEAAFQAQKCANPEDVNAFTTMSAAQAKRAGRRVALRADWEAVKDDVMRRLVWEKFHSNLNLLALLLSTGNAELVEGNTWHCNYWGLCTCDRCRKLDRPDGNHLGKILMEVRAELHPAPLPE